MSLFDSRAAVPHPAGYRDVAPADVPLPPGERLLLDVRERDEVTGELGHVPGATLLPMASVAEQAEGWDRAREILVVCRSGGRSSRVAQALVRAGFARVMNLRGGMLAWNEAGLPVER